MTSEERAKHLTIKDKEKVATVGSRPMQAWVWCVLMRPKALYVSVH
jgi:hypothetical protein